MLIRNEVKKAKTICQAIICQASQKMGRPVAYERSYADGTWGVKVFEDLRLELSGYAQEAYPHAISLTELPLVEYAYLAEAAAAMLGHIEPQPWANA